MGGFKAYSRWCWKSTFDHFQALSPKGAVPSIVEGQQEGDTLLWRKPTDRATSALGLTLFESNRCLSDSDSLTRKIQTF